MTTLQELHARRAQLEGELRDLRLEIAARARLAGDPNCSHCGLPRFKHWFRQEVCGGADCAVPPSALTGKTYTPLASLWPRPAGEFDRYTTEQLRQLEGELVGGKIRQRIRVELMKREREA